MAENDVPRVVIPFKDQDCVSIVKTQLKDLSLKLQSTIQLENWPEPPRIRDQITDIVCSLPFSM